MDLLTYLIVAAAALGAFALVLLIGSLIGQWLERAAQEQTTPADTACGDDGRAHRRMVGQ